MNEYNFTTRDLVNVLIKLGFSTSYKATYQKLFRLKWSNKFTPPVSSNGKRWIFTEDQLKDIARAFSPGGKGEWHFTYDQSKV